MRFFRIAMILAAVAICGGAWAGDYPNRPVTIVIPYGPGGATDIIGRVLADQLGQKFGQNFIIVNKNGAFGILAMQELLRNKADGYTLMMGNVSTNAITPVLFASKMSFAYDASIRPITELAEIPGVLVTTTVNFAPRTLAEMLAYAKANPGKLRYASPGIGSYPQFDTELFSQAAGVRMLHVPLKGGAADVVNSLATGDTQLSFVNVATAEGMVQAGRLTPLALISDHPLAQYPGVPTMAQAGYSGIGTMQWQAIFARVGTPQPIIDTLFKAITEVMSSEQTKHAFSANGIEPMLSASPDAATGWQQAQERKWQGIVAETHISLE
jgi:tripartite-type tricarboxylate transporter receptor subunit TctC